MITKRAPTFIVSILRQGFFLTATLGILTGCFNQSVKEGPANKLLQSGTSGLYAQRFPASSTNEDRLLQQSLEHPTSELIRISKSSEDYLKNQMELFNRITHSHSLTASSLYGKKLSPKEKASIFHQKDLFHAYLNNPKVSDVYNKAGFDGGAYLMGSYESDLGKLASYQELFTEKSAKSDFLFLFLQGQGPQRSIKELHLALEEMNEPALPFLNPELKVSQLRQIFKDYPILKGFLHELPGMIDTVLAYESNLISAEEFRANIHVNLFHCGPSAGYWQLLKGHLIPQAFQQKDQKELFNKLFKNTIYHKDGPHNLYYGAPSTFESFASTLFDRLSQATAGGYRKIDWEIGGNPLHNANSLLLEKNIPWTIDQLQLLKTQVKKSPLLNSVQMNILEKNIEESILYLKQFHNVLKEKVIFKHEPHTLEILLKDNQNVMSFSPQKGEYKISGKTVTSADEARALIHQEMEIVFKDLESKLGDPFQGLNWPK